MKGIGIILMVYGHTASDGVHFVYLFHMALFFMLSGYFWNDKTIESKENVFNFFKRRLKTLYIPFALSNVLFAILNNKFIDLGLYTIDSAVAEVVGAPIEQVYSIPTLLKNIIKIVFFMGGTTMGGATWFLRILFLVSIICMLVRFVANKTKNKECFFAGSIVMAGICAQVVSMKHIQLPVSTQSFFSGYVAFGVGYYWKRYDVNTWIRKHKTISLPISLIILLIMNVLGSVSVAQGQITNIGFYFVCMVAGWIFVYAIAAMLSGSMLNVLSILGRHTTPIILGHFLAFKYVTWAYISISSMEMDYLSSFPVLQQPVWLWPFYLLAGVGVPLLVDMAWRKCRGLIRV